MSKFAPFRYILPRPRVFCGPPRKVRTIKYTVQAHRGHTSTMSEYGSAANRSTSQSQADPKCRTCTDFKTWAKQQQRDSFRSTSEGLAKETRQTHNDDESNQYRRGCPLDKNELGRATWSLLHTISITFPEKPTVKQKEQVTNLMNSLANLYPCEYCARDLKNELIKEPIDASSQHAFAQWLCRLHNKVNIKIGKPKFDCTKIYERWRDGWLDGSCD